VIFDMDGLLLATERLCMEFFEDACRAHGITPVRSLYYGCIGTRDDGTRRVIEAAYGPDFPYERVHAHWMRAYHDHVEHRPVDHRPGAADLLALTRELGLPIALATSTRTATARRKLELAGLADFFRIVIGGDQVTHAKPHPEPYLTAAAALGVPASSCWAIEDSDNGVRAAHAAGTWVIQVPDLVEPSAEVRALGHAVMPSLSKVAALLRLHTGRAQGSAPSVWSSPT
jgi:HAD superfamily hydrolase (TIGR01509 family)